MQINCHYCMWLVPCMQLSYYIISSVFGYLILHCANAKQCPALVCSQTKIHDYLPKASSLLPCPIIYP